MSSFNDYHAHIYYEFADIEKARALVEKIRAEFDLPIGRVWDRPVGPHPVGSCQITVPQEAFAEFISWLMLNRGDLDVFFHANTGNDYIDHTQYIGWLGKSYPLKKDMFEP